MAISSNGFIGPASTRQGASTYSRPPSGTHIPRPISGTSRRASSTLIPPPAEAGENHSVLQECFLYDQNRISTRLLRSSVHTSNGMPPTSFPWPKTELPQSHTYKSYSSEPYGNFHALEGDNHVRRLSFQQSLSVLKNATTLPKEATNNSKTHIKTSRAAREITPRALMRPIQPSLPKSQTTGNLACFLGAQDLSPSKPPRQSGQGQTRDTITSKGIDQNKTVLVKDAIKTFEDTALVAPNSNTTNQSTLITDTQLPARSLDEAASATPRFAKTNQNDSTTSDLSVNDVVNQFQLEEQRKNPDERKPLLVNTAVASVGECCLSPFSSCSEPWSEASCLAPTSKDPRDIYNAEDIAFWIGRYVTTTDKFRKADCESLLKPEKHKEVVNVNSEQFEHKFDKLEDTRISRVLSELRNHCKTHAAAKSFARFESQLERKLSRAPSVFIRAHSDILLKPTGNAVIHSSARTEVTGIRGYSGNNATNQLSTLNAQATIEKLSEPVGRRPGLAKSKTTGNLNLRSVSGRAPTPGYPLEAAKTAKPIEATHSQNPLRDSISSTDKVAAIYQCEGKPQAWLLDARRNSSARTFQIRPNKATRSTDDHCKVDKNAEPWPLDRLVLNRAMEIVDSDAIAAPSLTRAPLIAGHGQSSISAKQKHNATNTGNDKVKEAILHARKRGSRQSSGQRSGEFVRKFVGASMREVRKMSRRVGSMGLGSSPEDTPVNT